MYSLGVHEETPVNLYNLSNIPVNPATLYRARLESVTPHVFLSRVLLFLNIAIYLVMAWKTGAGGHDFTFDQILLWGADYGPATLSNHEWWRLITCGFLHGGLIHLGLNMFVLWQAGPFVERLFGNINFLAVYFISIIGASLASLTIHPFLISVGASGAIFGLYGALLGFLMMQRFNMPSQVLSPLATSAATFVVYNLIFGSGPGVDAAAHLGGLVSGFLCGLALSVPIMYDPLPRRSVHRLNLIAFFAIVSFLALTFLPRPSDVIGPLQHFAATEKTTLAAYNDLLRRSRARQLRDTQMADLLDQNVIAPWQAASKPLALLRNLPDKQRDIVEGLQQYASLREQGWSLLSQGLRKGDRSLVLLAAQKQSEAERTAALLAHPK
jgi:rhomboid protease GluP